MAKFYIRLFFVLITLCPISASGQNQVGVNTNTPDASAVLHMESTTRGFLLPRMNSASRRAIPNAVEGLIVFDTDTDTFWYFSGGAWTEIISDNSIPDGLGDSDSDTRIFLEFANDNDQARFYQAGTEFLRMNRGRLEFRNTGNSVFIGDSAGANDDKVTNYNVYIGTRSGQANTSGRRNVALGYQSLQSNVAEDDNVAIGYMAGNGFLDVRRSIAIGSNTLLVNSTSDMHAVLGHGIMQNHTDRGNNFAIGNGALGTSTISRANAAVGAFALGNTQAGGFNIALGHNAGLNTSFNYSVFIGYRAGSQTTSGNRLYIDNSNTETPLIWGNFSTDSIQINGNLHISSNLSFIGDLIDISDRRLKENIREMGKVLPGIKSLQAFQYNLRDDPKKVREIGLMAQDVKEVFPFACRRISSEKNYLGVSYVQLIPITIQAVNELSSKQTSNEEEVDKLNSEIDLLDKEINKIKATLLNKSASTSNL